VVEHSGGHDSPTGRGCARAAIRRHPGVAVVEAGAPAPSAPAGGGAPPARPADRASAAGAGEAAVDALDVDEADAAAG
jgi:hypothetical protein